MIGNPEALYQRFNVRNIAMILVGFPFKHAKILAKGMVPVAAIDNSLQIFHAPDLRKFLHVYQKGVLDVLNNIST